jgi:MarR family transcriptional regulator, organic hydroperoxide resistance regulator
VSKALVSVERGTGDVPPLGQVLDFLRLLWAVDHGLNRLSKRMEAELGVTGPQRLAIRFAGRFPGISAGRLATILHMHPSTLTGILRRLELRKLLVRHADPRDGRRVLLGLTGKGRRYDAERDGTIEAIVQQVLAESSRHQIAVVSDMLTRLANALEPHAIGSDE